MEGEWWKLPRTNQSQHVHVCYEYCMSSNVLQCVVSVTASFYKTDSCVMSSEPFLPKTPPTASPYFQRAPRRSLTFELSSDSEGGRAGGTNNLTPRDQSLGAREHLGARKAAVITRRRLPLGDIAEHTQSSVRDCLIPDEPPNRDG